VQGLCTRGIPVAKTSRVSRSIVGGFEVEGTNIASGIRFNATAATAKQKACPQ
jgi:hypothetical protein